MKAFLATLTLGFVLLSCATLPKPTGGQALIVVPSQGQPGNYYVHYRINFGPHDFIVIDPRFHASFSKLVPPGEYEISSWETIYNDGKGYDKVGARIKIVCLPDTITVVPRLFSVTFVQPQKGGRARQHAEFVQLYPQQEAELLAGLSKDPNFSLWKVQRLFAGPTATSTPDPGPGAELSREVGFNPAGKPGPGPGFPQ